MSGVNTSTTKTLAWNGIKLIIPATWESRFPTSQHIVFEQEFTPQLQIRWEKAKQPSPDAVRKKLIDFSKSSSILEKETLPPLWSVVSLRFDLLLIAQNENRLTTGIFYFKAQKLIFLFEIMDKNPSVLVDSAKAIAALGSCSDKDTHWQFQDFTFMTPEDFALKNYTFASGLTRLSFESTNLTCHVCRLGPADLRLQQQSLKKILETLVGSDPLFPQRNGDDKTITLKREPSIWQQIRLRLRRKHPFILAEIFHDEQCNNLCAVVLTSRHPITIQPTRIFPKTK